MLSPLFTACSSTSVFQVLIKLETHLDLLSVGKGSNYYQAHGDITKGF